MLWWQSLSQSSSCWLGFALASVSRLSFSCFLRQAALFHLLFNSSSPEYKPMFIYIFLSQNRTPYTRTKYDWSIVSFQEKTFSTKFHLPKLYTLHHTEYNEVIQRKVVYYGWIFLCVSFYLIELLGEKKKKHWRVKNAKPNFPLNNSFLKSGLSTVFSVVRGQGTYCARFGAYLHS